MLEGILVVNTFLHGEKYERLELLLAGAAARQEMHLRLLPGDALPVVPASSWPSGEKRPDFVLFWDKDLRLARYLEDCGLRLFNRAEAIGLCDDKALTHLALAKAGIAMPKTLVAPFTYENIGYTDLRFLQTAEKQLGYPMVVKECFGSFGRQVYLADSPQVLRDLVQRIGAKPFLMQQFILPAQRERPSDLRIEVVGGQVVAAMRRYAPPGDFRTNVTGGGAMTAHTPTVREEALAICCCEVLRLDFAGVDLLYGPRGELLVCEVNSNAHFDNIGRCTGYRVEDAIFAHIKKEL